MKIVDRTFKSKVQNLMLEGISIFQLNYFNLSLLLTKRAEDASV